MAALNDENRLGKSEEVSEEFISSEAETSTAAAATYNQPSSFWEAGLSHVSTIKTVGTRDDSSIPRITGLCMMVDKQIVLCDYSNSKVKFVDGDFRKVNNELVCKYPPFDVAIVDDENVIVTMPTAKTLQVITVKPGVKLADKFSTTGRCYGVAVNESNIFVCVDESEDSKTTKVSGNSQFRGVQMLCSSGILLCTIPYPGHGVPRYICLNKAGTKICCSGGTGNHAFVTCFMKDGYTLFKFSDEIQSPASVMVDQEENVLVVDDKTNKLYAINANGSNSKCMLSGSKKYDFTSIFFSPINNAVLISCSTGRSLTSEEARLRVVTPKIEQQISKLKMYELSYPTERLPNCNPMSRLFNSIRTKLRK